MSNRVFWPMFVVLGLFGSWVLMEQWEAAKALQRAADDMCFASGGRVVAVSFLRTECRWQKDAGVVR